MLDAFLFITGATYSTVDDSGEVIIYKAANGDIVRTNRAQNVSVVLLPDSVDIDISRFNPVVSHDGTLVIYEEQDGVLTTELWSMSAVDGTGQTQLTTFGDAVNIGMRGSFSPDDTEYIFPRRDSVDVRVDIWKMDVDGSNLIVLKTYGGTTSATDPSWGSNNRIVFIQNIGVPDAIWTMDADGTNDAILATDLVTTSTDLFMPTWSPNSTKIALLQYVAPGIRLIEMDADGQNSTILYDNDGIVSLQTAFGLSYFPGGVNFLLAGAEINAYILGPGLGLSFAAFTNEAFVDWVHEPNTTSEPIFNDNLGFDFSSYFISGYKLRGEGIRKFQTNWLKIFHRVDDAVIGTGGCAFDFSGRWDFTVTDTSGRFTQVQRIVGPFGFISTYTSKRLKVRGRGDVLQIKILSVSLHPFDITGWSCFDSVNKQP